MTNAVQGEEYKLLKQKPLIKKIANVFIFLWFAVIICPALILVFKNADRLKEYAVVRGVYEANDVLQSQYKNITNNLLDKVDVSKYTSKIEVPEIKLDKVVEKTNQVNQVSNQLAKLGVKQAEKVADSTALLQQQVEKINTEIQTNVNKVKTTLETDIQSALKSEISGFADTQVQKQLNISDSAYNLLSKNQFGLLNEAQRKNTTTIYKQLAQTKLSFIRSIIAGVDQYFRWIVLGFAGLLLIVLLIPPFIVWWIAKKFSKTFTECPYCHKIFLTKASKFGLLKLFSK